MHPESIEDPTVTEPLDDIYLSLSTVTPLPCSPPFYPLPSYRSYPSYCCLYCYLLPYQLILCRYLCYRPPVSVRLNRSMTPYCC